MSIISPNAHPTTYLSYSRSERRGSAPRYAACTARQVADSRIVVRIDIRSESGHLRGGLGVDWIWPRSRLCAILDLLTQRETGNPYELPSAGRILPLRAPVAYHGLGRLRSCVVSATRKRKAAFSMSEEWRPVADTDGLYEVSALGRVRATRDICRVKAGSFLRQYKDIAGYRHVLLHYPRRGAHTCSVHGLVAEAFIGPRPAGLQVNHIDGNPSDNWRGNLEYVTNAENALHARVSRFLKRLYAGNEDGRPSITAAEAREFAATHSLKSKAMPVPAWRRPWPED